MINKIALFCTFILLGIEVATAQNRITGVVVNEQGEAIIGATVQVKGDRSIGSITDLNGKFSISASTKSILVISYVGMKTQEVKASTPSPIKIILESASEMLDEVVITGMQKMDKRLFTGATSKLNADNIKMDGVPDISRALEGRAAGVSVQNVSGTFGTAPKIRVRGATSIYGSSKPLWVVDGVIMDGVADVGADDLSSGDALTLISSAISGLNADDIESFQILKDGSATSIYGAKAMAGVIVITTKKGKSGTNKISYTGEFSMRLQPSYRDYNIMNSQEQMGVLRELDNNGLLNFTGVFRASSSGVYGKMYHLINNYSPKTGFGLPNTEEARNAYLRQAEYRNTDWFNLLFNNSISQNHAISFATGTDKATYYTSLSFMNDPGWTIQNKVQRYTSNINAQYNLSKKISLNLIANSAYRKQQAPGTLSSRTDVVAGMVSREFDINPYSFALNTSRTLDPNEFYTRNYSPFNIIHELKNNNITLNSIDLRFQGELKYKPIPKIELAALGAYKYSISTNTHRITEYSNQAMAYRAMGDATIRDNNNFLYTDPDVTNSLPISVLPKGGFYNENKYTMSSWDFRVTASYNDAFLNDTHIVNVFGGMEVNSLDRLRSGFDGVGLQYGMGMLPATDYRYFKQASEKNENYFFVSETRSRDVSFFATATYSYKGKYTINGTTRYEGSNKLGRSRSARWLPTWNISGAWNMHEEEWFDKLETTLSNFTLKSSYSLTADRGPASVSNSRVIIESTNPWRPFTNVKESALIVDDLENSELTYEKKHEFNIGAEVGFLKNRINLEVDWYRRDNFDLIGPINTPGVGGVITKYANVASMRSHGIEFTLSTKNIRNKDFQWSTDFIFSKTKNTVTKLNNNRAIIYMLTGSGFTMEGFPVRSLFSLKFDGLNEYGLPTVINEKGEKTVQDIWFQSRDMEYLKYEGPTDPTITGSLGNILSYKHFKLNLFLTYSFGNVIRLDRAFSSGYSDLTAMPREFKNRWTKAGDENITNIPVIPDRRLRSEYSKLHYGYNAYNLSDVRVAKGDFIRMKEISLSYDFPKKWIAPVKISALSLKLQGTNLFLIYADKKLNGQDPEFFNTGGVAIPVPRQFTLTLRVGI
ncbi:SusC/RagA family TonB-linked outer membrane protein [Bacteroides pyogenes]|uniref:SusC/RagA family TonB-linked outer membrane protein n=1 Tax=Bacteroides pyogenes TaxID=310300 RepID=UPI002A836B15|nr:SusC/RagA family TonB-linked outer membrane protein [Bacteroides pyogenes]MDY4248686.1 SusC/RagA family TonB-linked outer membrane protein [Bacteroides pyogenes]